MIIYILAIVLGLLIGIFLFNYLSKGEDKRIMSNISEKIMKQNYTYVIDGKRIDLKGDVEKGVSSPGVSVKGYSIKVPKKPKEIKPKVKKVKKKK